MDMKENQKRVFVFIDTNLLWNDNNKKNFDIFSTFFLTQIINLRDFFSQEIKPTEIKIVFPQTTICERYKQKFDLINSDLNNVLITLNKLNKFEQFDGDGVINKLENIQERIAFNRVRFETP